MKWEDMWKKPFDWPEYIEGNGGLPGYGGLPEPEPAKLKATQVVITRKPDGYKILVQDALTTLESFTTQSLEGAVNHIKQKYEFSITGDLPY